MKTKTVSLHYKRKRADAMRAALDEALDRAIANAGPMGDKEVSRRAWAERHGVPSWTRGFEVKRARTRFHYKVVAVSS